MPLTHRDLFQKISPRNAEEMRLLHFIATKIKCYRRKQKDIQEAQRVSSCIQEDIIGLLIDFIAYRTDNTGKSSNSEAGLLDFIQDILDEDF